jgi:hypothetical protein
MTITLSIDCARELLQALGLALEDETWWLIKDSGVVMPRAALAQTIDASSDREWMELIAKAVSTRTDNEVSQ